MKNTIYIIRHWESENNLLWIESTDLENKDKFWLSKKGKNQTQNQAETFKDFDIIYTSPFRRARETAEYFWSESNCEIIELDSLKEVFIWSLEECSSDELNTFFQTQENTSWFSTNWNEIWEKQFVWKSNWVIRFPNWESLDEADTRIIEAYEMINKNLLWKKVLIVTHGGLIKALLLKIGWDALLQDYRFNYEANRQAFKII